jgi:stress response protein YsnF
MAEKGLGNVDRLAVPGMTVESPDGSAGTLDRLITSAGAEGFVVRTPDGTYRRLDLGLVERVAGQTVYLSVPLSTLPALEGQAAGVAVMAGDVMAEETIRLPVVEEELVIDKHVSEVGRVRVHKQVEEYLALHATPLTYQEVSIERVPVDRVVSQMASPYWDGDVLVVPVVEEEVVEVLVRKALVLKEELRISRQTRERETVVEVPLRREHVHVEDQPLDPDTGQRGITS